jgi:hypothetical protein
MATTKQFSREELFDLVWSKPLTHLIKEFAYSLQGLQIICTDNEIPLPSRGYWSKIKFNKTVSKPKLPKIKEVKNIELIIRSVGDESIKNPVSELAKLKHSLKSDENLSFKVPDKLAKPHKYTLATNNYHKAKRAKNKSGNSIKQIDSNDVLSIGVSDNLFSRALRIMDTLIKLIEKRGHAVIVSNQTKIIVNDQSYNIRLTEKNKRVKRETRYSWDEYELIPTGNLCLKIDTYRPIKEWTDSKTKPLEDKLAHILAWIELKAQQDKEQEIRSAIWHEAYEKNRQKEEELKRHKQLELEKFKDLLSMATRWHKAQYLRNYIKEFKDFNTINSTLDSDKNDWIKWAMDKADWYDPFIEKNVELLEDIDRDTLENKKRNYW